jgi:hypothetical protein
MKMEVDVPGNGTCDECQFIENRESDPEYAVGMGWSWKHCRLFDEELKERAIGQTIPLRKCKAFKLEIFNKFKEAEETVNREFSKIKRESGVLGYWTDVDEIDDRPY